MADGKDSYMKELHKLARTIDTLTCGQAKIDFSCEEERSFFLLITPDSGYYKGATCKFKVYVPETFPAQAPLVHCLNRIYHPNIDIDAHESEVCVNLLGDDWQSGVGLDGCVMAVLYLFHHPNVEDALNQLFDGGPMNEQEFFDNVRVSLRGGEVDGCRFDQLIDNKSDKNLSVNGQFEENVSNDDNYNNIRNKEAETNGNRNDNKYIILTDDIFSADQVDYFGTETDDNNDTVVPGINNLTDDVDNDTVVPGINNLTEQTNIQPSDNADPEDVSRNTQDTDATQVNALAHSSVPSDNAEPQDVTRNTQDIDVTKGNALTHSPVPSDNAEPQDISRNKQDTDATKANSVTVIRYFHMYIWSRFVLSVARFYPQTWHRVLTIFHRFNHH